METMNAANAITTTTRPAADDITPRIQSKDDSLIANSKDVAAFFGKRHDNVIRDIEGLLKSEDTPTTWFAALEFQNPQNGCWYPVYEMTRDGFTLLVMGYTGTKAMEFKIRYIQEFNRMEAELANQQALTAPQTFAEALRLAADQQEEIERKQKRIAAHNVTFS